MLENMHPLCDFFTRCLVVKGGGNLMAGWGNLAFLNLLSLQNYTPSSMMHAESGRVNIVTQLTLKLMYHMAKDIMCGCIFIKTILY